MHHLLHTIIHQDLINLIMNHLLHVMINLNIITLQVYINQYVVCTVYLYLPIVPTATASDRSYTVSLTDKPQPSKILAQGSSNKN